MGGKSFLLVLTRLSNLRQTPNKQMFGKRQVPNIQIPICFFVYNVWIKQVATLFFYFASTIANVSIACGIPSHYPESIPVCRHFNCADCFLQIVECAQSSRCGFIYIVRIAFAIIRKVITFYNPEGCG